MNENTSVRSDPVYRLISSLWKCHKCERLLSGTIWMCEKKNHLICGKCDSGVNQCIICSGPYRIATPLPIGRTLSALWIPCHCGVKFPWKNMTAHENTCSNRQLPCPSLPSGKCTWTGRTQVLHEHFLTTHRTNIIWLENRLADIEINYTNSLDEMYLISTVFGCFGMYLLKGEDSLRVIAVGLVVSRDCRQYTLIFKVMTSGISTTFEASVQMNGVDLANTSSALSIPISFLSSLKCADSFKSSINIVSKPDPVKFGENSASAVCDTELLRSIECPACQERMRTPIYQCVVGHSVCAKCITKLRNMCPTCRSPYSDARNIALESFADLMYRPCSNSNLGCETVARMSDLLIHEMKCSLASYICPETDCSWAGSLLELKNHVKAEHTTYNSINEAVDMIWTSESVEQYLTLDLGELFICTMIKKAFRFSLIVQYVGPKEKAPSYEYSVCLSNVCNGRFFMSDLCESYTMTIDAILGEGNHIGFSLAMLEAYPDLEECTAELKIKPL